MWVGGAAAAVDMASVAAGWGDAGELLRVLPRTAELGESASADCGVGAAAGGFSGASAVAARGAWAGGAFTVKATGGGADGRGAGASPGVGGCGGDEKGRKREKDQGVGAKHRGCGGAAKRQSESYVSGQAVGLRVAMWVPG